MDAQAAVKRLLTGHDRGTALAAIRHRLESLGGASHAWLGNVGQDRAHTATAILLDVNPVTTCIRDAVAALWIPSQRLTKALDARTPGAASFAGRALRWSTTPEEITHELRKIIRRAPDERGRRGLLLVAAAAGAIGADLAAIIRQAAEEHTQPFLQRNIAGNLAIALVWVPSVRITWVNAWCCPRMLSAFSGTPAGIRDISTRAAAQGAPYQYASLRASIGPERVLIAAGARSRRFCPIRRRIAHRPANDVAWALMWCLTCPATSDSRPNPAAALGSSAHLMKMVIEFAVEGTKD